MNDTLREMGASSLTVLEASGISLFSLSGAVLGAGSGEGGGGVDVERAIDTLGELSREVCGGDEGGVEF